MRFSVWTFVATLSWVSVFGEETITSGPTCTCDEVKRELEETWNSKVKDCAKQTAHLEVANGDMAEKHKLIKEKLSSLEVEFQTMRQNADAVQAELTKQKEENTSLRKRNAELIAASSKAQEVDMWKQKANTLSNEVSECRTEMKTKMTDASHALEKKQAELKDAQSSLTVLQNKVDEALAQAASAEVAAKEVKICKTNLKTQDQTHEAEVKKHREAASRITKELGATKDRCEAQAKSFSVIYSATHFKRQVEHSKLIAKAFGAHAHSRLVSLLGRHTYELITLQALVYSKIVTHHFQDVVRPLQIRLSQFYQMEVASRIAPALEALGHIKKQTVIFLQKQARSLLVWIENYMDRTISNLAIVEPRVATIFPDNFHDRCFAFAFVSLVVYIVSEVCRWFWSKCVATPVCYMIGINRTPKSSRSSKSGKTSNKANAKYPKQASAAVSGSVSKKKMAAN